MKINQLTFLTTLGLYGYAILFWTLAQKNWERYYHISSYVFIFTGLITIYLYLDYYAKAREEK